MSSTRHLVRLTGTALTAAALHACSLLFDVPVIIPPPPADAAVDSGVRDASVDAAFPDGRDDATVDVRGDTVASDTVNPDAIEPDGALLDVTPPDDGALLDVTPPDDGAFTDASLPDDGARADGLSLDVPTMDVLVTDASDVPRDVPRDVPPDRPPPIDTGTDTTVVPVDAPIACLPGFQDCNGSAVDGCESNVQFDALNCGGCGIACGPGGTCSAGTCITMPPPCGTECAPCCPPFGTCNTGMVCAGAACQPPTFDGGTPTC